MDSYSAGNPSSLIEAQWPRSSDASLATVQQRWNFTAYAVRPVQYFRYPYYDRDFTMKTAFLN